MRYDVAVVGLGGMGSAALAQVAGRGARAIGVERFARLHENGASSGESRIIRKAYFEDPAYVPLLERSYVLWEQLQSTTSRQLMDLVGILMVGTPERAGIAGTIESARLHQLPIDVYDADQIARRFPGTRPRPDEVGLLERDAGMLFPHAAVAAQLERATALGAETMFERRVESLERRGDAHVLHLDDDETIEATRLILCPGMWSQQLIADLKLPLRVQRNVQVWFEPSTSQFDCGVFPTFFLERLELPAPLYGFPAIDGYVKAAMHGFGELVDPERPDRRIRDSDVTLVRDALDEWIPGAAANYARGKVCMYTLTPDGNFIVDTLPGDPTVAIACGFSGHGFKFCPVIGEVLAQLVLDGETPFDIDFIRLARFGEGTALRKAAER